MSNTETICCLGLFARYTKTMQKKYSLYILLLAVIALTQTGCGASSTETFDTTIPDAVSYWKLDNNVTDSGTSANNGTVSGTTTYAVGKLSFAIQLNGSSFVDCDPTPTGLPTGSSDRTFTAWINPSVSGQNMTIVGWGTDSAGLLSEMMITNANKLQFHGYNNDVTSTNTISSSVWTFVAITLTNLRVKLYINGVLDATQGNVSINTTLTNCKIGRQPQTVSQFFTGLIDEVGIWNSALSDSQISHLYNSGNGRAY